MPTQALFDAVPPFPDDIPTAPLPNILLKRLLAGDEAESARLFGACKTYGFFLLDLREDAAGDRLLEQAERTFGVTEELFDEGGEELGKFTWPAPGVLGYNALGSTKIENGAPDRFEWYVLSQDDILGNTAPQRNPKPIESNRSTLKAFLESSNFVAGIILSHLDRHLRLPPGTLLSRQLPSSPSGSILRFLKYPPQPEHDRRTSLFGHTDVGSITLLFNVLGGLQILPEDPGSRGGEAEWQYIKPSPGCVIVNLGDTMKEWTGGILRSNMHRVTYAPGEQAAWTRYSVGHFVRPGGEVSMKKLRVEGSLIEKEKGKGEGWDVTIDEYVRRKTALAREAVDPMRERDGRVVAA